MNNKEIRKIGEFVKVANPNGTVYTALIYGIRLTSTIPYYDGIAIRDLTPTVFTEEEIDSEYDITYSIPSSIELIKAMSTMNDIRNILPMRIRNAICYE